MEAAAAAAEEAAVFGVDVSDTNFSLEDPFAFGVGVVSLAALDLLLS